jgi:hypothetical protein
MAKYSTCGPILGTPDIYGIGVRIGLYAQWVATFLITLFAPENEEIFRIVNLTMQTAIFLGIAVKSPIETNVVEPIIVLFLMSGSLSSLTGNGITNFSHVSGVFKGLLYMALSAYGVWYWFKGVDRIMEGQMEGCNAIAFFGRVTVDGWFRNLAKGVSIIALVVSICVIGLCAIAMWRRFENRLEHAMARQSRRRPQVEIAFLVLSGGLIAFSICIVEYLIQVNDIGGLQNVDAVGQLIPFLIGILELTRIGWKILIAGLFLRKRCWFLFGKHL